MTTFADIRDLALKDSGAFGVGQSATQEDKTDTLRRANMMLEQWNRRRWLVYHLVDTAATCDGSTSYAVGAGQAFDVARPDRIEAAYIRQLWPNNVSPIDWPLAEITSREEYSRLPLKNLHTSPAGWFFYDSDFPNGNLFPWPIPQGQYEIHILTKAVLSQITDAASPLILPPEYEEAIYFNLMERLRIAYRLGPDREITRLAKASLNTLRRANFQIGKLRLGSPVSRSNWMSGFFFGGGGGGGPDLTTEDGVPITTEDGLALQDEN